MESTYLLYAATKDPRLLEVTSCPSTLSTPPLLQFDAPRTNNVCLSALTECQQRKAVLAFLLSVMQSCEG